MSDYSVFDQLPVELLHIVFNYFSTSELLFTFHNVNDYVDATLQSYSDYHLDFKSISMSHFRHICRHVQPEQVVSLTLSDADDTPGLSDLFFSRFRIEQFTRLRSLTLIEIEFNSLQFIFPNLQKLHQLCVLSFDDRSIRYHYPPRDKPVPCYLTNINISVLSQLSRLHLNSGTMLTSIPLPYLRHLKLEQCSGSELNTIFQHASQLKSLCVCLNLHGSRFELIVPPNRLTQLSLHITKYPISISEMEQLLSQLPCLKHLKLKAAALNNVADGYKWQALTTSLITFNFAFYMSLLNVYGALDSFCTPFWIEEKRWFVAQQDKFIFSIPYFAPSNIEISAPLRIRSTAPNDIFLYSHVNKIIIKTPLTKHNHYFTHIKTLELSDSISLKIIQSVVDLKRVEHLIISSVDDLLIFMPLKYTMPQLYKLTFKGCTIPYRFERIRHYQYGQILKLRLSGFGTFTDYITGELFRLFPSVQHLEVEYYIHSDKTMIRLIDGFKHLSNASFHTFASSAGRESSFCQNADTIIQHSQRLTRDNFKCRTYHSLYGNILCKWWIDNQSSTYFLKKLFQPPRGGYYWYRFHHIFYSFTNIKLVLFTIIFFLLLIFLTT